MKFLWKLIAAFALVCSLPIPARSQGEPTRPVPLAEAGSAATNANPLYIITYDHGGLILWGADHFARSLRNAVSWLDRYPSFKIGLDNEAYAYDALAEQNPQLLGELCGYLKKYQGRFGIGTCTYGQPLSTFINEESNVRQLVYGIRADQEHFGYTPVIYFMSEHAMHSQLPQLLAGCGFQGAIMRTHFMMYGYNPVFDAPIGWWVGLDGSRLPTVPTYPGEGVTSFDAPSLSTPDNRILMLYPSKNATNSLADFHRQFAHIQPLLATRADDADLRREELVKECEGNPEYRWMLLDELLQNFPTPKAEFKTLPNDFTVRMPWGYCGNEIWDGCRQAETQVLTAERLAAMEFLFGGDAHEADTQKAWKDLLVAQQHDIQICGLLADARHFISGSLDASGRPRDSAMQFFASRMKSPGQTQVTAFNPLSWTRTQWLEADLSFKSFKERGSAYSLAVRQGDKVIPSALITAERYTDGSLMTARVAFPAELPGLGFGAYSIVAITNRDLAQIPKPTARVEIDRETLRITTPFVAAQLNPDGGIASLTDRRTGANLFKPGQRSAFFAGRIDGESCESKGKWLLETAGDDAPWVTAREDGFIGNIPYTFEMIFRADTPQVDCRVKFHFAGQKIGRIGKQHGDNVSAFVHDQKLRFKLFPAVGEEAVGVRDLPFAVAETTNRYVEGIYWTALTDNRSGVALFNRGTMGSVRESDGGFSVPLAFGAYYIWGTRMLDGDFAYEFAMYPFTGDWRKADLHRRAVAYNFPVVSVSGAPGDGSLPASVQPLKAGSENVVLSALYTEQGKVFARLYECEGQTGEAPIGFTRRNAELAEVNLLGQNGRPAASPLVFRPWQVRTVQIESGR
jgi:hypothetical protein